MTAEEIINTLHSWQDKLQNSHIEDFSEDSVFIKKLGLDLEYLLKETLTLSDQDKLLIQKALGSFSNVLIARYESLKQYIDSIQEKIKHHQTHLKGLKTYHSHMQKR
ncbi:MAG: hypothetical protein HYS39_03080 [Proteobacteria bacterium]|nr:hypothetical protein [Pseudomonadota bacterium]